MGKLKKLLKRINDQLAYKSNKKRNINRLKQVQSFSMWSKVGQDYIIAYVLNERRIQTQREKVVYNTNLSTGKNDSVSYTKANVSKFYWS